jgi:hypothetical protein
MDDGHVALIVVIIWLIGSFILYNLFGGAF